MRNVLFEMKSFLRGAKSKFHIAKHVTYTKYFFLLFPLPISLYPPFYLIFLQSTNFNLGSNIFLIHIWGKGKNVEIIRRKTFEHNSMQVHFLLLLLVNESIRSFFLSVIPFHFLLLSSTWCVASIIFHK